MKEISKSGVVIVPDAIDVSTGAETPFGHRWGGDIIELSADQLVALQAGQMLALDVQSEYIIFLKVADSSVLPKDEAVNQYLKRQVYVLEQSEKQL